MNRSTRSQQVPGCHTARLLTAPIQGIPATHSNTTCENHKRGLLIHLARELPMGTSQLHPRDEPSHRYRLHPTQMSFSTPLQTYLPAMSFSLQPRSIYIPAYFSTLIIHGRRSLHRTGRRGLSSELEVDPVHVKGARRSGRAMNSPRQTGPGWSAAGHDRPRRFDVPALRATAPSAAEAG